MKFLVVIAVLVLSSCCTTKPYVAEEAKYTVKKGREGLYRQSWLAYGDCYSSPANSGGDV